MLYLQQLEALQTAFTRQAADIKDPEERDALLSEVERGIVPVQGAIREGVQAVVGEFREYMGEFRFPKGIAEALQVLVDWG